MEVGTAIDIYTTVLGWTLYDRLWDALGAIGIAQLPFGVTIARVFAKHWGEGGDAGADSSIRNLELDLIGMATVVALAGQPALELRIADLSHTAACGAHTVQGGATGTLYDGTFALGGDVALVPVWWRAVMAVASGLSNVAVAATPCDANLRQLNYRIDNTRIADPELQQQVRLFGESCFEPARARFAREHASLPAGYAPDDLDWLGSRFFQDTAGYYDDPNPNLAPRPKTEIPEFPYDPARDADLDPPPASGLGRPTCRQWWTDAGVGLRKRLLDQIDPNILAQVKLAAGVGVQPGAPGAQPVEDAQIRKLMQSVHVDEQSSRRPESYGGFGNWLEGFLGGAGTMYHGIEQRATFYALQQAAPIGQSLILMAIYLCLPFVLVFSGYSIETALLAGLGLFAVRFLTALWALAAWVDTAMVKALGIEWWKANSENGVAAVVATITGSLLYMGLPVVWFLVLGWAGHHLAASGLAGGLSEGLGKAAGGGVRAGASVAKGAVGKRK
jgi:hypothetical protein